MNAEHANKLIGFDAEFSIDSIDRTLYATPGVYCLYCFKTHIAYVGGTRDCKERIAKHFRRLRFGDHPCKTMLEHFKEYGEDQFIAFTLEHCKESELAEVERLWINRFGESRVYNKKEVIRMDQEILISELCDMFGVKPDTLRVIWKRNGLHDFRQTRMAKPDEIAKIKSYYTNKKARRFGPVVRGKRRKKTPEVYAEIPQQRDSVLFASPAENVSPASEHGRQITATPIREHALNFLLVGIVVGHAGLIWYDCAIQWLFPGTLGGSLGFFMVLAALLLSTDPTRVRTSEFALYFVGIIDGLAWWVHFPTFQNDRVSDLITGVFTAFLCAASWTALYLYRDSKLD